MSAHGAVASFRPKDGGGEPPAPGFQSCIKIPNYQYVTVSIAALPEIW
jgi:hypothetical protein